MNPNRSSPSPRTGPARWPWWPIPTTWSSAPPRPWPAGPGGQEVVYCMVTSGEAGIDSMAPDECRAVREAEQIASAGSSASTWSSSSAQDGVLEYGVPLGARDRRRGARHRPEIVITGNFRDTWGGRNLNQADHIAVGRAVARRRARRGQPLDLQRAARRRARALGRRPAGLGRGSPEATHAVDTTDTFDAGVASLGRTRPTSTGSAGKLRPPGDPRGVRSADRPAAGRRVRRAVRGVPDGLGRVASLANRTHRMGAGEPVQPRRCMTSPSLYAVRQPRSEHLGRASRACTVSRSPPRVRRVEVTVEISLACACRAVEKPAVELHDEAKRVVVHVAQHRHPVTQSRRRRRPRGSRCGRSTLVR